jgi:demethylspheroidene O-methyltransferase
MGVSDAWRLRWTRWRNGMLAHQGFRRWASSFAPFRPIARGHARALFDLTAGFVYAQTAQALVESGLIAANRARAACAETLLKAGLPLRLTERIGSRWVLGMQGAVLAASPGVAEMIAHHRLFYADLADPLATLRGEGPGRLAELWRYDGTADPDDVAAYSALMAASQPMVAEQAIAAYDFRRLDVGGGAGAFVSAVAAAAPALELGLFDLPPVIEVARARFAASGLAVATHAGSFGTDTLPGGYDLITLVRVLHDHDDAPVSRLLAQVRGRPERIAAR